MNYSSSSVRPFILNFDVADDKLGGDASQEGQQVKLRVVGKAPSQKELDEHMATHLPYRNWCKHCISGRGQNDHHRKN